MTCPPQQRTWSTSSLSNLRVTVVLQLYLCQVRFHLQKILPCRVIGMRFPYEKDKHEGKKHTEAQTTGVRPTASLTR